MSEKCKTCYEGTCEICVEEIDLLNAAFDQFISDTTAWELTDPKVQEKKQDLLNKVREERG